MLKQGPTIPNWLASALISLVIGGVVGFYVAQWASTPRAGEVSAQAPAGPSAGRGGGPGGMGGGFGGGFGGAQDRPNTAALTRWVRTLAAVEDARAAALTDEQRRRLRDVLAPLSPEAKVTEQDAERYVQAIEAVLNEQQRERLSNLLPRRGGFGGGGMGGRGGGPGGSGPPPGIPTEPVATGATPMGGGGPMAGGGGPMGGGDPDRPFAEGTARDRLEALKQALAK